MTASGGTPTRVSIYLHFQQSIDQPSKVTNLARGQLNRKMFFSLSLSLSLFPPENFLS